jgi:hypothetical protein
MKTMIEYATMAWDDPEWIDPVCDAVFDILERHKGRLISTTLLVSELGVRGLVNAKAVKAMGSKLAALRKPGERLCGAWAHSATRFSPFKDRTTGVRLAAIDWLMPATGRTPAVQVSSAGGSVDLKIAKLAALVLTDEESAKGWNKARALAEREAALMIEEGSSEGLEDLLGDAE